MSKEVKPREYWIHHGTAHPDMMGGGDFDHVTDNPDMCAEDAIHVIEYTPEVKRAVVGHDDLLFLAEELLKRLTEYQANEFYEQVVDPTFIINRAKGLV